MLSYLALCTISLRIILFVAFALYHVAGDQTLQPGPASYNSILPGPKYPPTKGQVWPKPQQETKEDIFYTLYPALFNVTISNNTCTLLTQAVHWYLGVIRDVDRIARRSRRRSLGRRPRPMLRTRGPPPDDNYRGTITALRIDLTRPCEDYPHFDMDESYNLTVTLKSKLQSDSIWGIMRGIDTFAQLFYLTDDYDEVRINKTYIVDYPRYAHRGLLLDTARHFISVANIRTTLDAMAMNKMNVFHWHIVDDQSFPYQSNRYPELSQNGAYHQSMVYSVTDIKGIIEYARQRGIRVVPEFDVPGHTRSWGVSHPSVLTKCYDDSGEKTVGLGPLNPLHNATYKLLHNLFQEVQQLFPDQYFHIGGDEVDFACWSSNPEIQNYMVEHKINDTKEIHSLFMRNAIPLLGNRSKVIVWQEVFDDNVTLSSDTLVQVWKYGWTEEMINVLQAGHKVLFSASWYLDLLDNKFQDLYAADPRQMVADDTLGRNVVGGEACMWGEMADDTNVLSRVWPRASAVAEVLWSEGGRRAPQGAVSRRIEEHACRMRRRGVPAQPPGGPGFCVV